MKLIGPWASGYTRRVGITLKLLDVPFEHLDWAGRASREAIRQYSPMVKVPALALDDGESLVDSGAIIDYLYELAGPKQSLLPASGKARRATLQLSAFATEVYAKQIAVWVELNHSGGQVTERVRMFVDQVLAGLETIEARAQGPWLMGEQLSHADVMAVVSFQSALDNPIFSTVTAERFPRLAAVTAAAMRLPAFQETEP